MAIINNYTDSLVLQGKRTEPYRINGDESKVVIPQVSVADTDDDTSVYRFARINAYMVVEEMLINNTAITAGTDYDIGIYDVLDGPTQGAVKNAQAFATAVDMSSARSEGAGTAISGLSNITVADMQKQLWELAGDTLEDNPGEYDLALTANTVGTAAGTIVPKTRVTQG